MIRYWLTYIGFDVKYQYGSSCSTDYIEVSFGNIMHVQAITKVGKTKGHDGPKSLT